MARKSVRSRAIGTAVAAAMPLARDVWDAVNKDDRAAEALSRGYSSVRASAAQRTPLGRAESNVAAVRAFAETSDDPRREEWLRRADDISARVRLARGQRGKDRRASTRQLRQMADELVREVIDLDH